MKTDADLPSASVENVILLSHALIRSRKSYVAIESMGRCDLLSIQLHYHDNPHPIMTERLARDALNGAGVVGKPFSLPLGSQHPRPDSYTCLGHLHCQHLGAKHFTYVSLPVLP